MTCQRQSNQDRFFATTGGLVAVQGDPLIPIKGAGPGIARDSKLAPLREIIEAINTLLASELDDDAPKMSYRLVREVADDGIDVAVTCRVLKVQVRLLRLAAPPTLGP